MLLIFRVKIGTIVNVSRHPRHKGSDSHIHNSIRGTVEHPPSVEYPTIASCFDYFVQVENANAERC